MSNPANPIIPTYNMGLIEVSNDENCRYQAVADSLTELKKDSHEYVFFPDQIDDVLNEIPQDITPEETAVMLAHIAAAPYHSDLYAAHVMNSDASKGWFLDEMNEELSILSENYSRLAEWYRANPDKISNVALKAKYWDQYAEELRLGDVRNGNSIYYWLALQALEESRIASFLGPYEHYVVEDPKKGRLDPSLNVRILKGFADISKFKTFINTVKDNLNLSSGKIIPVIRNDFFLFGAGMHGQGLSSAPSASGYAIQIPQELEDVPEDLLGAIIVISNINENIVNLKLGTLYKTGNAAFTDEVWENLREELDYQGDIEEFKLWLIKAGSDIELVHHEICDASIESTPFQNRAGARAPVELAASIIGLAHLKDSEFFASGLLEHDYARFKVASTLYMIKSLTRNIIRTPKGKVYGDGMNVYMNGLIERNALVLDSDGRIKEINWNLVFDFTQELSANLEELIRTEDAEEVQSELASLFKESENYEYATRIESYANSQGVNLQN